MPRSPRRMGAAWRLLFAAIVLLGLCAPPASALAAAGDDRVVRVSTPAYRVEGDAVTVAGYARSNVPGAPALPVYGALVELPPTGNWTLDVTTSGSRLLPGRYAVAPAPTQETPAPDRFGLAGERGVDTAAGLAAVPDPAIYGANAFYPASPAVAGEAQWQRGKRVLSIQVFPFQYNPVTQELLYHPNVQVVVRTSGAADALAQPAGRVELAAAPEMSQAGEAGGLVLRTSQRGMHRLTYADLAGKSIDVAALHPDSFMVTHLGQPVRIQVTGAEDGKFDPGDLVIFYAEPYVGRWMSTNVYRFSYGSDPAPTSSRMDTRSVQPTGAEPVVTSIYQTLRIEQDLEYFYDYAISTEADHIFDSAVDATSSAKVATRSYDLALDDPLAAGQMTIRGVLYGGAEQSPNPDNWAKLQINSHDAATFAWNGRTPYTITAALAPMAWLDQPANKLNLVADLNQFPGLAEYWYNPDWVEVRYPALADAEVDRIQIEGLDASGTSAEVRVTGFSAAAVRVYDVRDPRNPVQMLTTAGAPVGGATQISFWDAWPTSPAGAAYSLSTDAALIDPAAIEVDTPSSWKSPAHEADYIAIVHGSLWNAIDPLLSQRAAQGLRVAKVDVQDVYDEFNYGRMHQNAIRDFLAYAYANWNGAGPRPKYVLLVGDATFDFKGAIGPAIKNLVPTFLGNYDPWMIETASDSRFATFDGPGDRMWEMIVGRIPAQTGVEVTDYVNKVLAYENPATNPDGAWQNRVAFVADDDANPDGNFHQLSDNIRLNWLPSYYSSPTVYYNPTAPGTGYSSPSTMKSALKQTFNDGAILMQWFGHASFYRWGSVSGIWNTFDPANLNANTRLPFVAAYSCVEGYFINIDSNSAPLSMVLGEQHLLQQGRGGIAGLSPSGKHVGSALTILDQGLTKAFFQDRIAAVGDAVDAARRYYFANSLSSLDVLDTSILFGDPALKLRLPLPPPVAPNVGIGRGAGSSADLRWSHLEPDTSYDVWRGASPYFDPASQGTKAGSVDASGAGYLVGATVTFNDSGAGAVPPPVVIGDPATNYYWVVRGANWRGVSPNSNRVGEFDFALTPGVAP